MPLPSRDQRKALDFHRTRRSLTSFLRIFACFSQPIVPAIFKTKPKKIYFNVQGSFCEGTGGAC
ncbi:hypothetical protein M413DRAFT_239158 [Hebeloma cylindrosporum]|uniref:Uncharacterized protein n=1 Tax=Hebeloma cylindrosporum TaxID=76867 RepID=A0A0C3C5M4_HEBCY|nr:hypothetical protein M413DRAFT_239158 [Hebeloma cylindrosporum h7]